MRMCYTNYSSTLDNDCNLEQATTLLSADKQNAYDQPFKTLKDAHTVSSVQSVILSETDGSELTI